MNDMTKRALSRMMNPRPLPPVVALPDGWRLVPDKPTSEMFDALYQEQLVPSSSGAFSDFSEWTALLNAAPKPPIIDQGPELRVRIQELEAEVARLKSEAKGLEDLL